ncbi:MAG: hypothetical protein WKI04_05120 [Ferruginibacter sp.]
MPRKKWTPKTEITASVLKIREKKKWQLALRRYVLEQNNMSGYAVYFGLDILKFRQWVEIQFSGKVNWENFGTTWQLDHVIPVGYFDFSNDEELRLCWNFINIRVNQTGEKEINSNLVDLMAVKPYFESLYQKTGYSVCAKMIGKISQLQEKGCKSLPVLEKFLKRNQEHLETLVTLNKDEFISLNNGALVTNILLEREILRKFG